MVTGRLNQKSRKARNSQESKWLSPERELWQSGNPDTGRVQASPRPRSGRCNSRGSRARIPRPRSGRCNSRGSRARIPRPRSGRCNSSPHACGVPPGMKRAECTRQGTTVFHSSRGSRAAIPRPRSGRCNSSPHACGVPPGMKRAECGRQRTAVFHSSRGSRAASATSRAATRGTAAPVAPTAERSHCRHRDNHVFSRIL